MYVYRSNVSIQHTFINPFLLVVFYSVYLMLLGNETNIRDRDRQRERLGERERERERWRWTETKGQKKTKRGRMREKE